MTTTEGWSTASEQGKLGEGASRRLELLAWMFMAAGFVLLSSGYSRQSKAAFMFGSVMVGLSGALLLVARPDRAWLPFAAFSAFLILSLFAGPQPVVNMDAVIENIDAQVRLTGTSSTIQFASSTRFTNWVSFYSGWPAEQYTADALSGVTGLPLTVVEPTITFSLVVTSTILFYGLSRMVLGSSTAASIATCIFMVWPDVFYWAQIPGRQFYAFALFLGALISLFFLIRSRAERLSGQSAYLVIFLLFSMAIFTAHHLTSVLLLYILVAAAIVSVVMFRRTIPRLGFALMTFALILVAFGTVFWFNYSGAVLATFYPTVRSGVHAALSLLDFRIVVSSDIGRRTINAPEGLPVWEKILPIARLAILAILGAVGSFFAWTRALRPSRSTSARIFAISFTVALAGMSALALVRIVPEPLRFFLFIGIPVAMATGAFAISPRPIRFVGATLIGILVFLTPICLWGNTTIPIARYDPSYDGRVFYLFPHNSEALDSVTIWADSHRSTDAFLVGVVGRDPNDATIIASSSRIDGMILTSLGSAGLETVRSLGELKSGTSLIIVREDLTFRAQGDPDYHTMNVLASQRVADFGEYSIVSAQIVPKIALRPAG